MYCRKWQTIFVPLLIFNCNLTRCKEPKPSSVIYLTLTGCVWREHTALISWLRVLPSCKSKSIGNGHSHQKAVFSDYTRRKWRNTDSTWGESKVLKKIVITCDKNIQVASGNNGISFSWHFDISTDVKFHPSGRVRLWSKVAPLDGEVYALVVLEHAPEVVDWWGKIFPKLLGGGWSGLTVLFGLGKWQHQLEVAKKKKHLLGSLFVLPCFFFCGWISRGCLIKDFSLRWP